MDHDSMDWQNPIAVPIPEDDPTFPASVGQTQYYMLVPGSRVSQEPGSTASNPILRNRATAWFDASQVYGSSKAVSDSLRTFTGGLLKTQAGNIGGPLLPNAPDASFSYQPFLAGDYRANFHPGLTALHTLFVREHNNIATQLAHVYPTMSDEELYQTSRLIVGAEIFKIHTVEWSNQLQQDPADNAVTIGLAQTFGQPRPAGWQYATHATPEEFVAAYKWHSFVNPKLVLRDSSNLSSLRKIDYLKQFMNTKVIRHHGIERVLAGLGSMPAGTNRFNNLAKGFRYFKNGLLQSPLANPLAGYPQSAAVDGIDFAVIDIVRDRERGIPKYNTFRNLVGGGRLPAAQTFDDLADDAEAAQNLARVYKHNIANVDAVVGIMGEHMYANQGFPVTQTAAFLPFVVSRFSLDRFYHEDFTPAKFTLFGLGRINQITLAQIFCEQGVQAACPIQQNNAPIFLTQSWPAPDTDSIGDVDGPYDY
jgi:hypothetical protein